eukprot:gene9219-biopygen19706
MPRRRDPRDAPTPGPSGCPDAGTLGMPRRRDPWDAPTPGPLGCPDAGTLGMPRRRDLPGSLIWLGRFSDSTIWFHPFVSQNRCPEQENAKGWEWIIPSHPVNVKGRSRFPLIRGPPPCFPSAWCPPVRSPQFMRPALRAATAAMPPRAPGRGRPPPPGAGPCTPEAARPAGGEDVDEVQLCVAPDADVTLRGSGSGPGPAFCRDEGSAPCTDLC